MYGRIEMGTFQFVRYTEVLVEIRFIGVLLYRGRLGVTQ